MATAARPDVDEKLAERLRWITAATELERAGGDWTVRHVLAVLGCHKATLYRNNWLMGRAIHQPGGVVFRPADVRLLQANNTGLARRRR
jgi:hypothetical protein